MAAYKPVVARRVSSHALTEFDVTCERCGKPLKGKGNRGDKDGHVLCKDCGCDQTWKELAAGRIKFNDLQVEEVA